MMSRSTRYFWPTTTLLISLSSGGTNALACCTSALMALIPVFIFRDDNARWTILPADVFRKSQTGRPWRSRGRPEGCVQSRMVAADARRIMEAKPFPPRYLGGYACCDDSWTHPAGSAGPGGANQFLNETVPMRDCPVGTFDNSPAF